MSSFNGSGVPLAAWPLGAGLFLTSSVFFGNLGLSLTGPLPIIRDQLGAAELSEKQRVRVWRLFFDAAAPYVVGASILTSLLNLSASYLTHSPNVRLATYVSIGASLSILPYTRIVIFPVINRLKALDAKSSADWTPQEKKQSREDIDRWNALHMVRYIPFGVAWVAGVYALVGVMAAS